MDGRLAFERVLASLHDAAVDDAHWPTASALIDRACGTKGNLLTFADGRSPDEVQILIARFLYRGERDIALEAEYFADYYPRDERIPRLLELPDSQIVHVGELYTDEEHKASVAYNEALPRGRVRNGINVRLDGPHGSRITWTAADPVDTEGWSSARVDLIARLLPHLRQYVRVRHALAQAGALGATLEKLLEKIGTAIIHLDRSGRIVAANERATELLRAGDVLVDVDLVLGAKGPENHAALEAVLTRALPGPGARGASGSLTMNRPWNMPGVTVHVSPVGYRESGFGPADVAAMVLVTDHAPARVDRAVVAAVLGLTPAESEIAVLLAEGKRPGEIARLTARKPRTVRWHVQQIYEKRGVSRRVDLVREVLALAGVTREPD